MRIAIITIVLALFGHSLFAQEFPLDSIETIIIDEVIIISKVSDQPLKEAKALGSLDNYLEKSTAVNMVKRGAYAWEPMLQGMSSERSLLTVDGMRIYPACTDKMDPITSYVETTNLSKANIQGGSAGAEHGGTIAGSIDLMRKREGFKNRGWGGSIFSGFETVNQQKIIGTEAHYSNDKFFTNLDFTHRDADNYKAGGNKEVLYSQFTKSNFSAISGYKFNDRQSIEASFIYDRATDVGYPALTMDVSLAEAFIGSLQYSYADLSEHLKLWETKFYFNSIKHVMDDSQRPDVPIRMDMPGWSKTYGFYSKLKANYNRHNLTATLSGHLNNSFADMTMYSNNPNENDMYMMTWPDVNTIYTGLFLEDNIKLNAHFKLNLSAGIGLNHNSVESEFGLNSLKVFYPEMNKNKTDILKNLNSQLSLHHSRWTHSLGFGFGERSASVSEAFGFYLFNSFDGYDYVGNPNLKPEKSISAFASTQYKVRKLNTKLQANYFRIYDYIIGKPQPDLIPMTIGANGIKVYEALDHAEIFNIDWALDYSFLENWNFNAKAVYRLGQDLDGNNLPLIQPFSYGLGLSYQKQKWVVDAYVEGNAKHSKYSEEFGESAKGAYTIANLAVSKSFDFNRQKLTVKLGAENLFDEYYSTFSDWNNIPRMGRNLFINLIYNW